MALRAKITKHDLAAMRIANVLAEISAHFSYDFLALRVSLSANFSKRLLDRPERVAIVAFQNLSQVIRVERAFGELVCENSIEKLSRPRLALHDQINCERLQFGPEFGILAEKNIRKFWVFDASQGSEDALTEMARVG